MKKTYLLRLYDETKECGEVVSLESAIEKMRTGKNSLAIELENEATIAFLKWDEKELWCYPFCKNIINAWLYRKIKNIKLQGDYPTSHFKFVNPL